MTSYKTLIFGTIAFVCAAAPAFADVPSAVPGPTAKDVPSAVPGPSRQDVPSAVPGPTRKDVPSAVPGPGKKDVPSAVPKYVVLTGVPGVPPLRVDLSWLEQLIGH